MSLRKCPALAPWGLAAALGCPGVARGSDSADSVVVSLEGALNEARAHAPQLAQLRASTAAARARADAAGSGLYPQVQGQASYQRATRNFSASGAQGALPGAGESSFDTEGTVNFGVQATQLLWDFGRTTGQRDAAQATAAAQAQSERVSRLQVELDVRSAYSDAQAQRHLLVVAREAVANQERHKAQIEAFIEAGTRPPIDLLQARTESANARVQLVQAENAYLAAKARLNLARGVVGETDYEVDETPAPAVPAEDQAPALLVEQALGSSAELSALDARSRAQAESLRATAGAYWPILDATTGLTEGGPDPTEMVWNWNAALRLSWPLYQGGLTTAQEAAGREEARGLVSQAEGVRQQVRLRVEQARLGIRGGKAALDAAGEALVSARERLKLAEGRYETGLGSIIELSDAQLALTNAAAQQVRAERDLAQARAQLRFALGILD